MRRRRKGLSISADDARQALAILISEGKIAATEVRRAIDRRQKLIREIRERLEKLGADGAALVSNASRRARPVIARAARRAAKVGRKRARRAISAATRAKYRAQGRYMAAVRTLPKAVRKQIRDVREKSGVEAAIKAAFVAAKKAKVMRHIRERVAKA